MIRAGLLSLALAAPLAAQERVAEGTAAELRALDRLSGELTDIVVPVGETARLGRLEINVAYCRYPVDNPAGDGFAYMLIDDLEAGTIAFQGWMIASSPALNPLDHIRYDVWVLRCSTS